MFEVVANLFISLIKSDIYNTDLLDKPDNRQGLFFYLKVCFSYKSSMGVDFFGLISLSQM